MGGMHSLRMAAAITVVLVAGAGVLAQQKKTGDEMENQIRRAGFQYFYGTVFGDPDEYLKAARMPLYAVRDGVGRSRDDKETRAMLVRFAERIKATKLNDDDRKLMVKNLIALFDEASIQFVGANTATLTFLVQKGKTEKEGDQLATLTLYRKDGGWKIISEVTDSAPVPPEYLK
jgi:hypothetical protein